MRKRVLIFIALAHGALLFSENCCCGWLGFDILYWKSKESAVVATNRNQDVFITDNFTKTPIVHPHFDWSLGYRVKGGFLSACSLWELEGSWLHLGSHLSQHRSTHNGPFEGMFPIWSLSDDVIAGDYVNESELKWKLTLNLLDLQLGRCCSFCQNFDFHPFFGLRSAWIKQHGSVKYQGGIFLIGILEPGVSLNGIDFIRLKNNYWGIGPRVGLAPQFCIGWGLSLNAEAAISGLYGCYKIKQKETYLDKTRFSSHRDPNRFRWIADLSAGVEWKVSCSCLILGVDWEYHLFFRQFELEKDRFDLIPKSRNLSTQGVTFSSRFEF